MRKIPLVLRIVTFKLITGLYRCYYSEGEIVIFIVLRLKASKFIKMQEGARPPQLEGEKKFHIYHVLQ